MADSVYKVIQLVGSSDNSWEEAAKNAVEKASQSLRDLRVAEIEKLDMPPIHEFLEMVHDAGAGIYACRMSVDMMDLGMDDFFDGVDDIISAGDFMEINEGAQLLFT